MNTHPTPKSFFVLCAGGLLALTACGGGGANGLPTAAPPSTPVVITVVVQPTAAAPAATSVALPSLTPVPVVPTLAPTAAPTQPPATNLPPTPKPATATPKPTLPPPPPATPAPSVSFSASAGSIYKGEEVKLSWTTKNVDGVWLDNVSVPPSSEKMVSPSSTRDYKLSVKHPDGSQKDFVKTITVKPNEYKADLSADNETLNLWLLPAPKKACTTLHWSVSGKGGGAKVVDGSITGGGLNISLKPGVKPFPILLLPYREVCFNATSNTTYTLHAVYEDGVTRNDSVTVRVVNEPLVIKITPIFKP